MPLIVSLAMIVPGAVSVVCATLTRPRASRTAVVGAAAMLVAMIAMATGALGAPIVWTVVLIGVAVAGAVARRIRRGRGAGAAHEAFDGHRPVGIVVMAALLAGMPAERSTAGHVHGPSGSILTAAAVAYGIALAAWMLRHRRDMVPGHTAEGVSMIIMIAGMLSMPLII